MQTHSHRPKARQHPVRARRQQRPRRLRGGAREEPGALQGPRGPRRRQIPSHKGQAVHSPQGQLRLRPGGLSLVFQHLISIVSVRSSQSARIVETLFESCALRHRKARNFATIQQHRKIHRTHRARRAQITTKTHKSPPHRTPSCQAAPLPSTMPPRRPMSAPPSSTTRPSGSTRLNPLPPKA
jgi:hypothetical protein